MVGQQPSATGNGCPLKGSACLFMQALNYTFRRPALLREAITHCSWPDAASACYQRLEVRDCPSPVACALWSEVNMSA